MPASGLRSANRRLLCVNVFLRPARKNTENPAPPTSRHWHRRPLKRPLRLELGTPLYVPLAITVVSVLMTQVLSQYTPLVLWRSCWQPVTSRCLCLHGNDTATGTGTLALAPLRRVCRLGSRLGSPT